MLVVGGKLLAAASARDDGTAKIVSWSVPPADATAQPDAVFAYQAAFDYDWNDAFSYEIATDGERTFLAEAANNRVLVWHGVPATGVAPQAVLGQIAPDGVAVDDGGLSPASLHLPQTLFVQDGGLFIRDHGNGRLVVYQHSKLPCAVDGGHGRGRAGFLPRPRQRSGSP